MYFKNRFFFVLCFLLSFSIYLYTPLFVFCTYFFSLSFYFSLLVYFITIPFSSEQQLKMYLKDIFLDKFISSIIHQKKSGFFHHHLYAHYTKREHFRKNPIKTTRKGIVKNLLFAYSLFCPSSIFLLKSFSVCILFDISFSVLYFCYFFPL